MPNPKMPRKSWPQNCFIWSNRYGADTLLAFQIAAEPRSESMSASDGQTQTFTGLASFQQTRGLDTLVSAIAGDMNGHAPVPANAPCKQKSGYSHGRTGAKAPAVWL